VRPSVRNQLLLALACVLALAITGVLALAVPGVRLRDAASLHGFTQLDRPRSEPVLSNVAHLADPVPYALMGLALVAVALARGRRAVALAIPLLLVGTGVTTQVLKQLTAQPRHLDWLGANQVGAASWPSGHATAAMTIALCLILASPAALRPLAALAGGAFTVAVSYAILALSWHFPSDVLGAYLVAATWTLVAVAALEAAGARRSPPAPPVWRLLVPAAAGGVAWAGAVALARPGATVDFALERPAFLGAAIVLALVALSIATMLARATRV
jgi:membrane-associated phospholipid phosphatase